MLKKCAMMVTFNLCLHNSFNEKRLDANGDT